MATLVGLGSLRAGVMGLNNRPASPEDLRTMRRLLDRSLEEGALGITSGLIYAPGAYASTDELIELVKPLQTFGRPYVTHVRGETDMVADSIREAIEIGRAAAVALHISHHKVAGKQNWGRTEETLGVMSSARTSGIDLTIDVYPYTAGSTLLHSVLPLWVQDGGVSPMVERLHDSAVRDRIRRDFETGLPGWQNLRQAAGWEGIVIANCPGRPEIENWSIEQLAEAAGKDPSDCVFDLIVEQRDQVLVICHILSEADVQHVVASDEAMIGSDGIPLPGKPHPRWAGSFSRILGRYCRENRLLDLSTAIRKMTSFPAQRFSLSRRGTVAKGNFADLVLFDPYTVVDRATYEEPLLPPVGVHYVFVNGRAAVSAGALTGTKAGKFLTPG
jgi:dihydroorotase/N-acyl-D-amino-acid deacylase